MGNNPEAEHDPSTCQSIAKSESNEVSTSEIHASSDAMNTIEEHRANGVEVGGLSTAARTSLLPHKRPPQPDSVPPAKRRTPSDTWSNVPPRISSDATVNESTSNLSAKSSSLRSSLTPPIAKPECVVLSSEQRQIIKLANEGKSIFYTGCAGKSHLSAHTSGFGYAGQYERANLPIGRSMDYFTHNIHCFGSTRAGFVYSSTKHLLNIIKQVLVNPCSYVK